MDLLPQKDEIKDEFRAKGIQKAKKAFSLLSLPEKDRQAYVRYQDDLKYQASLIESNYGLGRIEGREEGFLEGELKVALRLVAKGMSVEEAAEVTGVDVELLQGEL